jgi:ferrous iron transport protein A
MLINLLALKKGEKAEVSAIEGGCMLRLRLEGLGIREGKTIRRVSSQLLGGPVIVAVDGRQTAMGRRMAEKIKVKTSETPER